MTRFRDGSGFSFMSFLSSSKHRQRRKQPKVRSQTLAEALEPLEHRKMLSATTVDVSKVLWNGAQIEAVRNEYVLRMPQANATKAVSVLDYAHRSPVVNTGWSLNALGLGFFKVTAPGASQIAVTNWATSQGAKFIEVNAVHRAAATPNDPLYADTSNWAFPRISAPDAWNTSTGSASTVVAVLDTGIDYNHPDLVDNLWKDSTNGSFGYNAFTGSNDPMDDNGHGTFSAGLIGAVGNNTVGLAGVNWDVQLMGVKVLDSVGVGTVSSIIAGVNYVTQQKVAGQAISTMNCGFAQATNSSAMLEAFETLGRTGVVIVCAAGNESNDNDANPRYPANFSIPTLITVAASDQGDNLAGFSNFGATTVHLTAPGVGVLSTRASGSQTPLFVPHNGAANYTVASGTSFSSALVAGTAALLKAIKPTASATQIRRAILDGADRVNGLTGLVQTGARLNVAEAVDLISSTVGAVPVASFKAGQLTQVIEGNAQYSVMDIKVVLDRPPDPGKTASVFYETRPGGSAVSGVDFVAQSGFVTFSGSQMEKTIRLRIVGDRVAELDEQFAVRLVADKSRGVELGDTQINITIRDDDYATQPSLPEPSQVLVPRVSITQRLATDANGNPIQVREGEPIQFVITLDRRSTKPVTVKYRTHVPAVAPINFATPGRDFIAAAATVTFKPGETSKVISVKTLADKELEMIDPVTGRQRLDANGNSVPEVLSVLLFEPNNAVIASQGSIASANLFDVPPPAPMPPAGTSGFTIDVRFTTPDSLTSSQQAVFAQAAARWQEIIVGDLPDVVDPATGQRIDDILIDVSAVSIDGPQGVLGQAGPTQFRTGSGLPWKGIMEFDTADLAVLETSGQLVEVIVHEMAHVLGFGTIWATKGLLTGGGTNNPIFVGANALREYNTVFGQTATGVPVENTGGQGTRDGHWRETLFGRELMTGFLNPGVANPISRITVGQFQDLGYAVDYRKADAFLPPLKSPAGGLALPIRMPQKQLSVLVAAATAAANQPAPTAEKPSVALPPVTEAKPAAQPAQAQTVARKPVTATATAKAVQTPVTNVAASMGVNARVASELPRTPVTRK